MMMHIRFWFMFQDDVLGGEERKIRKKSREKNEKYGRGKSGEK